MKILVVGNGGREHVLVWKLAQSKKVNKIYCAPGNAGISNLAECVDLSVEDLDGLCDFAKSNQIDLTIVGPEAPLVKGIADRFESEGLRVFAPDAKCSQLEGSKAFTKEFLMRHKIPTAAYAEFTDFEETKKAIGIYGYPMVIKADGLAAGKGVVIAENEEEALTAIDEMMNQNKFGAAGSKIVVEEFLSGIETSILCFVDGKTLVPMVSAQDYKKIFDNDEGPNTGGMGTYSPSLIYTDALDEKINKEVLEPIMAGFKKDDMNFKGILFIGLMIKDNAPKVLEFNVRFGDPETQTVITRLKTDLVEIIESILDGNLAQQEIEWIDQKTVCVVMASGGYPEAYEKGKIINGLDGVDENVFVFHAGTKFKNNQVVTDGGRVLGVTAWAKTTEEARMIAYENIKKISFDGAFYRKDIGKIINK